MHVRECYSREVRSSLVSLIVAVAVLALGCGGGAERPPPYQPFPGDDDGLGGAGGNTTQGNLSDCDPIPQIDDSDACDSATVNLLLQRPTLYFVLDTSGSMIDRVASGSGSKLKAAQSALRTVVREVGYRINYGMATFPGPELDDDELLDHGIAWGCEPGEEVFAVEPGDELVCLNQPATGPTYERFNRALNKLSATGKTPLAPTLDKIAPELLRKEGRMTLILLTDGHPNCGDEAQCDPEECPLTDLYPECIEVNCCSDEDAVYLVRDPSSYCIDGPDSADQLAQLHAAGIDTYVIGLLGESDFDDVMNELAVAGGQPRSGKRAYYDVKGLDELTDVVRSIGVSVAQSCTIQLSDRPPDANTLNVYFDAQVIPSGREDGWTLERDMVTLHGAACDQLKSGNVLQVRLISGCETIIR